MLFTDWFCDWDVLQDFGEVIKKIRAYTDDPKKCHNAFLLYVARKHPHILKVGFEPEVDREAERLLSMCGFSTEVSKT